MTRKIKQVIVAALAAVMLLSMTPLMPGVGTVHAGTQTPTKVTGVKASVSKTKVTVKWKKAKRAKKYQVKVKVKKGKKWKNYKSSKTKSTTFKFKGKNGASYKVTVRAIAKKKGKWSKAKTVKIKAKEKAVKKNAKKNTDFSSMSNNSNTKAKGKKGNFDVPSGNDLAKLFMAEDKVSVDVKELKAVSYEKTTCKLAWKKVNGAAYYTVVKADMTVAKKGNDCRKKAKVVSRKQSDTTFTDKDLKTHPNKAMTSNPRSVEYEFLVIAYDKNGNMIASGNSGAVETPYYWPKYHYELHWLHEPWGNTSAYNSIYIKTDCPMYDDAGPNFTINVYTMDGKEQAIANFQMPRGVYADLEEFGPAKIDENTYAGGSMHTVKGGYLFQFEFILQKIEKKYHAGDMKVCVREFQPGETSEYASRIAHTQIVHFSSDHNAKIKQWYQSIIDEVTTENMTKKEKMEAIVQYMKDNSEYSLHDDQGYIRLLSDYLRDAPTRNGHGKYEFDSYTSPGALCMFGEMIGYPVHALYHKYPEGSPEWKLWHYYVEAEDGSRYEFCPSSKTNIGDRSKIKKLDLDKMKWYT